MAKAINMPKMGNTVESVIVGEIKINVGDTISSGDILFSYETDKSTTEYKSKEFGKVIAILMEEGEEVLVLVPIIILGEDGEDISEFTKLREVSEEESTTETKSVIKKVATKNLVFGGNASPRAKAVARELGVSLQEIGGTGIDGRIQESDILVHYHGGASTLSVSGSPLVTPVTPGATRVEFSPLRQAIGDTMVKSLLSTAQLTMGIEIDATTLLEARKVIKAKFQKDEHANSSINDLIIFALSRVLPKHKHLNAISGENYSDQFDVAHISVAVNTTAGLFVPVVKDATLKTLSEISVVTKDLATRAQSGTLKGPEMQGGTFTISNLGLSGVSFFTPVLNPPQVGLLGVGSPVKRLKFNDKKEVIEYSEITLSLTMDHRPNDGVAGTLFLNELKKVLENIDVLLEGGE